jgi:hypothetical protein
LQHSVLLIQNINSRPFMSIIYRISAPKKDKGANWGRPALLNADDAASIIKQLPDCRRDELRCLAEWSEFRRGGPYNSSVREYRTMAPYPQQFIAGSADAIDKIRRAAAAELARRPSAPAAAQADLAALPWCLPGGKMDRVEGRDDDGGLVLCGWVATAVRELQ